MRMQNRWTQARHHQNKAREAGGPGAAVGRETCFHTTLTCKSPVPTPRRLCLPPWAKMGSEGIPVLPCQTPLLSTPCRTGMD